MKKILLFICALMLAAQAMAVVEVSVTTANPGQYKFTDLNYSGRCWGSTAEDDSILNLGCHDYFFDKLTEARASIKYYGNCKVILHDPSIGKAYVIFRHLNPEAVAKHWANVHIDTKCDWDGKDCQDTNYMYYKDGKFYLQMQNSKC